MTESRFIRLLERFDPFDPELVDNFFDVCGEVRERCPVVYSEAHGEFWTISRFSDVMEGFADDAALSPIPTATIPPNPNAVPLLPLQSQPAEHREMRRLLNPSFRAGALARLEPGIRDVVNNLIDGFIEQGHCELIADFARRLPGDVILGQLLGLPDVDVDRAYHWVLAIMHGHGTADAAVTFEKLMEMAAALVERRRGEPPRDDVVGVLLSGTIDGRRLTDDEILRTIMLLIAGGLDTTAHTLGNFVIRLAHDPALRARLEGDATLVPSAIEELLRIDPPAGGLVRTAQRDLVVGGRRLRAGDRVLLLVAGANRDPWEFDDPDEIDIERTPNRHLSWGYGTHYCIGVHLARLELRIALEELLARVKDIRLTDERIVYDTGCSRGPVRLHITFAPGPRRAVRSAL